MITLRHRSASGNLSACWEFCSTRLVLEIVFRLGSAAPRAMTVKVCAVDSPRIWCHPITRLDGESWRVLPALYVPANTSLPGRPPTLAPRDCTRPGGGLRGAIPCELHEVIGRGSLVLTNAPELQDRELEELGQ